MLHSVINSIKYQHKKSTHGGMCWVAFLLSDFHTSKRYNLVLTINESWEFCNRMFTIRFQSFMLRVLDTFIIFLYFRLNQSKELLPSICLFGSCVALGLWLHLERYNPQKLVVSINGKVEKVLLSYNAYIQDTRIPNDVKTSIKYDHDDEADAVVILFTTHFFLCLIS